MSTDGFESSSHCAFTLDPDDYEFEFEGAAAELLEPADRDEDATEADESMVWRCRRKTNPGKQGCPFHHHLNEDEESLDEETLARAFLAVIRDEFHEGSWIKEELNERAEGCVLEIVPREDDPHDGPKRRCTQFIGARFGKLSMTYEQFEASDRYPLDLRGAIADRINWSNAVVPRVVFATGLSASAFVLDNSLVAGDVCVGYRTHPDGSGDDPGLTVSMDHAKIDGDVRIENTIPETESETADGRANLQETGVSITGADVDGDVKLNDADVGGFVWLRDADVGGYVKLNDADVGGFVGLRDANVGGKVSISHANVGGKVSLSHANMDRDVLLVSANVGGKVSLSHANVGGRVSLSANVGGDVELDDANMGGRVSLPANVGGDVKLDDANMGGEFSLRDANVGGKVWLRDADVGGDVKLDDVSVGGDVSFRDADVGRGIRLDDADVCGYVSLRDADVGGDISLENMDVGSGYHSNVIIVVFSDALILGSLTLREASVHGWVDLAGDDQSDAGPPTIHERVDFSGLSGAVRFHEASLVHPGVRAVPAHNADFDTFELYHATDERGAAADIVYDFEKATLGTLLLNDPESERTGGRKGATFDRLRFVETTFDGFQFSKHRDRFSQSKWDLEGLRDGGSEDLAVVDRLQFEVAEEIAKDWLRTTVATDAIDACKRLDGFAIVGAERCREKASDVATLANDTSALLDLLRDQLDIMSIRIDGGPVSIRHDQDGATPRLTMLQYVPWRIDISADGPYRSAALDLRARVAVEWLFDEINDPRLAPDVIEVLIEWHEAERSGDKQAGSDDDHALPEHAVSRAVAFDVEAELDIDAIQRARLQDAWVSIARLWQFLDPKSLPESLPDNIDKSPIAACINWHADPARADNVRRYPPAEWTARLIAQVTAAVMQFEAAPISSPSLETREATYSKAKTAAADTGANSAASHFFFQEKSFARALHWQGFCEALRDSESRLANALLWIRDCRCDDRTTRTEHGILEDPADAVSEIHGTPETGDTSSREQEVSPTEETELQPDSDSAVESAAAPDVAAGVDSASGGDSEPASMRARRFLYVWIANSVLLSLTGYGERPVRPVGWSVGVVVVFFLIYLIGFSLLKGASTLGGAFDVVVENLLPAAVLSLGSFATLLPTTPLLSGSNSPCGADPGLPSDLWCQVLQLLAEAEGFLGVFLVAVFVFTLTRSVQR